MKTRFLLFFLLAAMFLPMAVNAQETFTVYPGASANQGTIPFSGVNVKYQQRNQMIFPATDISGLNGKDITAMTFYVYSKTGTGDLGNWIVSLGETTATNFPSAAYNNATLTQVYSGPMVFNAGMTEMTVYFDNSYHYNGSNLLVQFNHPDAVTSATNYSAFNFTVISKTKGSYTWNSATAHTVKNYLPKVTFTYNSENANPKPTNLTVNHEEGASIAELSWTSTASAWNVDVNGTVTSVNSNQFTLMNLVMETPCVIKVQADFGGGETSDWTAMAFTPTNQSMIGSGTGTNNNLPINTNYKNSITQQILTIDELGGPATITGIDLFCSSTGYTATQRTRTFDIYMVYTDKENFESNTDQVIVTSSDKVFNGSIIFAENGWTHIVFTTPFDYDGGSNILLVVDDNKSSYYGPLAFRSFTTTEYQGIYFITDQTNIAPTGALNFEKVDSYSRTTTKNQIRVHKGNTPECLKPIGITVNHANGANSAQVTCQSDAELFNIDINGTVTSGVTMPYTLTNLVMETAYTIKVQGVCNGTAGDWSRPYVFTPTNLAIAGEGNATFDYLPVTNYYTYGLTQQIYTPEELGAPAPIKGIEFYNTSEAFTRKIAIYMVATDKDSFDSDTDQVLVTTNNRVFTAANVTFAADGWTYIPFTTPFDYDGESNVLLVIDDDTKKTTNQTQTYFRSYTTTENQGIYFHTDYSEGNSYYNPSPTSALNFNKIGLNSATNYKSQARFHKGNGPSCPKPIHLAVSHENGATTAQVTCESDAELFNIDIKVGTAASTIINGVTLPYTLENLVMETKYTIKLQADCGGGDVSAWSNAYTFTPTNLSIAGDGNETSTVLPTNSYFKKSLTQQIFTVEELGGPALIKGIELHTADTAIRKFNIYMVATDKDHFESVDDRVVVTNSNLVFGSTTTTNGTNVTFIEDGWTYIPFSTPFDYDGGSNVILVVDDNSAYYGESACPFLSFTTTENQAMYFYADDYNPDPKVAAATFDPDGNFTNDVIDSKNQVIFHKGNPPTCPRPIHFAVNYTGGLTAEVTWECDADVNIMVNNSTVATGVSGNSYTLTDLALNTNYTVKVQADCGGGDLSEWTNPITFRTDQYESMCSLYYTLTDSYGDSWNGAKLLVKSGSTTLATLKNEDLDESTGEETQTGTLRYEHGKALSFVWTAGEYDRECSFVITDEWGMVICQKEAQSEPANNTVLGTYTMNCDSDSFELAIDGYGDGDGKWYFITSPVDFAKVENVENCIDEENEEDYDLFYFDQAAEDGLEWRNYKVESFTLEPGKGYLYANKHDVTLVFTGHPYSGTGSNIPLTYSEGASWAGWNLVGNPLDVPAWPSRDWYWMNNAGTDIILSEWDRPAEPMEGVFVNVVSADEIEMSFDVDSKKGTDRSIAGLSLNLSQGRSVIDRAIVRFDEASPMPKFQLNTSHTKVYIPQGGQDYAMVYSEGMGELPVSFKAEKNGNYTLNSNALGVSFSYLHLIDNMTGADVDLLATPSYTFEARTTDYASRFRLVFVCGDANDDNDFAFFSNGNWVISNDGEATVQVIDMVGRILKSETISGNASISINAAPGVYMLRLINNENMKVQKVVVR